MVLPAFVWPHVAYLITRHSQDPYRAEARNLLVDSAMAASFVPLIHFNLLPSVLLLTLTMVDKITTGIRGLWARSVPAMLGGGLVGTLLAGLHWAPDTSMRVIVACLPVMALHTISVSVVSYQLIRKTAHQNQLLDELRRVDALTGLFVRGHWQEQAEAALRRHHNTNQPACMLMMDIDHFRQINDQHGHTVGDEVIRALAHVVRGNVRAGDCAGAKAAMNLPSSCPACSPGMRWPLRTASASKPKACGCAACPMCASPAASVWQPLTTGTTACAPGSTQPTPRCTPPKMGAATRWPVIGSPNRCLRCRAAR